MNRFEWSAIWQICKRYRYWVGSALLGLFLLLMGIFFLHPKQSNLPAEPVTAGGKTASSATKAVGQPAAKRSDQAVKTAIKVDVKGAVQHPGLYQVEAGARLADAVQKAGGFQSPNSQQRVNLAQSLEDGMVIYIAKEHEEHDPAITNAGSLPGKETGKGGKKSKTASASSRVSLNHASQSELEQLSGVGPKKAEEIISYREEHPFQSVDELKTVSGIGPKRFEQLKEEVAL